MTTTEFYAFSRRHLGPRTADVQEMLQTIGVGSLDELVDKIVPESIRLKESLHLPQPLTEAEMLDRLKDLAHHNKIFKSYLGQGYYDTIVPTVILRNILENPGWYTQYTPYQAEIAQGRLEALLNFQTMVADLTGLPIANASLLDEGTAAAEAMTMLYGASRKNKKGETLVVSDGVFPHTIEILQTRAEPLGITIQVVDIQRWNPTDDCYAVLLQYPNNNGEIIDYQNIIEKFKKDNILVALAADLLSLTILKSPGEMGADVAVGTTQRLGVPMGFGGPHAAYFACQEEYKRVIPGRIIGVSVDATGKTALRMALQTREQHIRREKATSNICTAQVLLAIMSAMYAVYHGPEGLKAIAYEIHRKAVVLKKALETMGFYQEHDHFFDTLKIEFADNAGIKRDIFHVEALRNEINFRYFDDLSIGISIDETTTLNDLDQILQVFHKVQENNAGIPNVYALYNDVPFEIAAKNQRKTDFMTHEIFHKYHAEHEMLRYIKRLEKKDLSLTTSMISLGSCTMKLNATTEMLPVSYEGFSKLHPFVPVEQTRGYQMLILELGKALCHITGFSAISFQPNSGAQGEYAGLLVIRAYHHDRGEEHRNIILIPASAHGTNPASAVMAGYEVVVVKCDELGNIDVADLQQKAIKYSANLAGLMVTYPSTHGVFEETIREVCAIIHEQGGQVYMDGANMNAQVGLTSPGYIGADVCHLNLHKTFCIPHGGGGPGMGPICVAKHLSPYLPEHIRYKKNSHKGISAVSAAHYGSASILVIPYAYICMMGGKGLTDATRYAMLNANYMKAKLEKAYPVLYKGTNGFCAHEFILDLRPFKHSSEVEVEDVAKRLMDYNFHAPTVSFPVAGTLMIEPTESESKEELDRFCEALLNIREEIQEILDEKADKKDNVLKHAPHTAAIVCTSHWNHAYSREKAAFALPWVMEHKFWPSVSRVNNTHGDRNLICTCPPTSAYQTVEI